MMKTDYFMKIATVYEGGGGSIFIWSDRMMQCFPLFRIAVSLCMPSLAVSA